MLGKRSVCDKTDEASDQLLILQSTRCRPPRSPGLPGGARRSPCINNSPKSARLTKRLPCKRPDRGHGRADRRAGLRALWADGGGDQDCGGGEQVDALNLADYLADEIYLFHADEEKS